MTIRNRGGAGISCNVVAGTNHDHIFVPVSQATAAMKVLHAIQERAVAENSDASDSHDFLSQVS